MVSSTSPFKDWDRGTPSEVLPRVYLADIFTVRNKAQLSALGITHVISVIEQARYQVLTQALLFRTLHIPLSDNKNEDILTYLPATTSFIRDAFSESPDSRVMVSGPPTYRVLFVRTDGSESGSLSDGHQSERNCHMRVSHRHGENDT